MFDDKARLIDDHSGFLNCLSMVIIKFKAAFGELDREVELFRPYGGGGSWHIYVDRFLFGHILQQNAGWRVMLNGSEFTQGDADQILERITAEQLDSWE